MEKRKGTAQQNTAKKAEPVAKKTAVKQKKAAKTKMYAPTGEQKAYKYKPTAGSRRKADESGEGRRERTVTEVTQLGKFGMVFCAFIFSGMVLFVLMGYEKIARAYSDINTLNNSIDEAKLHIKELDVAIECAVTIDQAQEAAKKFNMQYPTKSQYQLEGGTIAISATTPPETGTGDGDTAAGGNTTPDEG